MSSIIFKSLIPYLIGLSITLIVYYTNDHSYSHGPSLFHLTFLLTMVIGIFLFLKSAIAYFVKGKRKFLIRLTTHGLVSVFLIALVWYVTRPPHIPKPHQIESEKIYVGNSGDSTFIYSNSSFIYLRVNDSVLIDNRNPTMMEVDVGE